MQKQDFNLQDHLDKLTFSDNIVLGLLACLMDLKRFREGTAQYSAAEQDALQLEKAYYLELKHRLETDNVRRN